MNTNTAAPKVDLKNTSKMETSEGKVVFQEGFVLRKVSKFLTGSTEDQVIPLPVMYEVTSGKILKEFIPEELQAEYEGQLI